jgi:hypothetical protein
MVQVIGVVEYKDEDFAIIEDTAGKAVITKNSDKQTPLYDKKILDSYFGRRTPCALLQGRDAMMT